MSGERNRSVAEWPKLPRLSSTLPIGDKRGRGWIVRFVPTVDIAPLVQNYGSDLESQLGLDIVVIRRLERAGINNIRVTHG
jgi:hypothetical protein